MNLSLGRFNNNFFNCGVEVCHKKRLPHSLFCLQTDLPWSLLHLPSCLLPQARLVSASAGERGEDERPGWEQDCPCQLLGNLQGLASFAGAKAGRQISWRTGCVDSAQSIPVRVGLWGPYLFPGAITEWSFQLSTWKRIHSGPAFDIPIFLEVLIGIFEKLEGLWHWRGLALRQRHEPNSRLEMWPLRSLEEATISEHSVAIISWNIQAANLPTGVSFNTLSYTWCCLREPS